MRKFEVRILWDGQPDETLFVSQFEVDSSRYETADVAVISCVVSDTKQKQWYQESGVQSPWLVLQIRDTNASEQWYNIFEGRVDAVRRPHFENKVEFECRDALAALIDLRVQDGWMNYNGHDLINLIAQKIGIDIEVNFPSSLTDTMCGQFWQVEHKRNAFLAQHRFQTAADLLYDVARNMSCDLYAHGEKIIFAPIYSSPQDGTKIFDFKNTGYRGFLKSDIFLNEGIVVHIASWDSRQRMASDIYYDGNSFVSDMPDTSAPVYSFRVGGRRLEDLKRLAHMKYNRLMSHSTVSEMSIPGVIGLEPRSFLHVLFDNTEKYFSVERIVSRFSCQAGFVQNISSKQRIGV